MLPAGGNRCGESLTLLQDRCGLTHRDFRTFSQREFTIDSLTIDVGPIEAPQVTEDELLTAQFNDAVLLGNNLVQELDGIVGMPSQGVLAPQLHRSLTIWS